MNGPRGIVRYLGLALVLVAPSVNAAGQAVPSAARPGPTTYDDVLAAVAVPGFAGVWVDEASGDLVVALTRPSERAARDAQRDLARVLRRPGLLTKDVLARPATYAFRQLNAWRDAIAPGVLALPGAVSADVDERANVLRFGVTDVAAAAEPVTALRLAHGVPAGAVVVEHATYDAPTLDDKARPLLGGVTISWRGGACTLGFMATLNGVAGFVTNSHCSAVRGVANGELFTQFLEVVAQETADPPFFTQLDDPACPAQRLCRYSDALFAELLDGFEYVPGYVARPPVGSNDWDGGAKYRITGEHHVEPLGVDSLLGEEVHRVAQTTGHRTTTIEATCSDRVVQPVDNIQIPVVMLCQGDTVLGSNPGDSGGTVFRVTADPDVTLVGVNWNAGGVFSPIANIEYDMGLLETCAVTC